MKRSTILIGVVCLLLAGSLWWTSTVRAEPQATYEWVKSYIGPGDSASNGAYSLSSSIGQALVGQVSAGNYIFGNGFWGGGIIVSVAVHFDIYLPLAIK